MATDVRTEALGFPACLGKVFPGAVFATASVPLTQNIRPVKIDHAGNTVADVNFNGIFIQAHSDNNGLIYVCSNASPPDLVLYTNVLGEVAPGVWYPRSKEWANNRDISKLFIGAANATDFAIVVIDQF